jgi:hypothetical protein
MKLKIDNETLAEEFFDCTRLLGVVAPRNDYQMIWAVNQYLGFSFRINHNLEIQLRKKDRNYFFSIYEYKVPSCTVTHYLYNNEYDGEYLLPEFKHLDFLWLIKDDDTSISDLSSIIHGLKSIPGVQLVVEMTNEKIRNKQHLIF